MPIRRSPSILVLALLVAAWLSATACASSTEPTSTDVDRARQSWLANRPGAYEFRIRTASSWFPQSGYTDVRVHGGLVVAAFDSTGSAAAGYTLTIDGLWDALLSARQRTELNSARFDRRGIPVDVDMGKWEVDGGVHYSISNFRESR